MTRYSRALLALLAALALALVAAACGDDDEEGADTGGEGGEVAVEAEPIESNPDNSGKSITIGSKNFTEQFILGEIYSQALEAAGFDVKKELNLGAEQVAFRALKSGQVDAYPEYTGTALTSFFGVEIGEAAQLTAEEAYEQAKEEYAKEGIVALPQGKFDNTYVVASTVETKKGELQNAETISDLASLPNADQLEIAGFPECRQRADCLLALENVYDWEPEFVANEGKFQPLDSGATELGFVFGTDAQLSLDDYATYEPDKKTFPPYHITLGIREQALDAIGPEGEDVLMRVQEPLTEEVMRELNARVDLEKEKPADVARQYLQEAGFIQ